MHRMSKGRKESTTLLRKNCLEELRLSDIPCEASIRRPSCSSASDVRIPQSSYGLIELIVTTYPAPLIENDEIRSGGYDFAPKTFLEMPFERH
jgi:hypothetical protein